MPILGSSLIAYGVALKSVGVLTVSTSPATGPGGAIAGTMMIVGGWGCMLIGAILVPTPT